MRQARRLSRSTWLRHRACARCRRRRWGQGMKRSGACGRTNVPGPVAARRNTATVSSPERVRLSEVQGPMTSLSRTASGTFFLPGRTGLVKDVPALGAANEYASIVRCRIDGWGNPRQRTPAKLADVFRAGCIGWYRCFAGLCPLSEQTSEPTHGMISFYLRNGSQGATKLASSGRNSRHPVLHDTQGTGCDQSCDGSEEVLAVAGRWGFAEPENAVETNGWAKNL